MSLAIWVKSASESPVSASSFSMNAVPSATAVVFSWLAISQNVLKAALACGGGREE